MTQQARAERRGALREEYRVRRMHMWHTAGARLGPGNSTGLLGVDIQQEHHNRCRERKVG